MVLKIPSVIEKIKLEIATFNNTVIEPTFINLIYGNNGTGKSTIARTIADQSGLVLQFGKNIKDYKMLVFNQDFISANFQNYRNLKSVFTIGEKNIEIQNLISEKSKNKAELDNRISKNMEEKERRETESEILPSSFYENCWNKTKRLRADFDLALTGCKTKVKFANTLLQIISPINHSIENLKSLFEIAFDPNARTYSDFILVCDSELVKGHTGYELLAKIVTSSIETPFVNFINAINATDWVNHGHANYNSNNGKCPYCQQNLPDDFEVQIAACFDAGYQQDIDNLKKFCDYYENKMSKYIITLKSNLQDAFPKLNISEYKNKIVILEKTIQMNLKRLEDKMKEPSLAIKFDETNIIFEELNAIIADFNKQIEENNSIVLEKQQKQAECKTMIWEYFAWMLKNEIKTYKTSIFKLQADIAELAAQIKSEQSISQTMKNEISSLGKQGSGTKQTIDGINKLLIASGFQGFSIREKEENENIYEIIRSNGKIAENLSEGERNFIAFLYFYFLVCGSHSDVDIVMDKIVVIDDPVSSMDSRVMYLVGTLVRELIEICRNNVDYNGNKSKGDYIKQIFVMTHNVYFYKRITSDLIDRRHYKYVCLFLVDKIDNVSSIKVCERQSESSAATMENYTPIQSHYSTLWNAYKELDSPSAVLNTIRQIFEYYFIQICGYNDTDIQTKILNEILKKFNETEGSNNIDYYIASAILSHVSASVHDMIDGLHYIDDSMNISQYKSVFKMIFEIAGQAQHYEMMMGEREEEPIISVL